MVSKGPKAKADDSALSWRPHGSESSRFVQFCKRFLKVQHGFGAGSPLVIRDWQRDLVASVLDADPVPRLAGWMIARGNGKSSLLAALSVYKMFTSGTGGSIVCCARTQSQAQILFTLARDYVETSPELASRCQVGRDRLYVPRNRTDFECLVSEPNSLEGLNFSFCAVDEIGVTPRPTVDVLMLAQGKRPESTLVGIGTPPADPTESVLIDWRNLHQQFGDDAIVWREFSADGFEDHDVLCEHCIRLANPAYGDFLAMDAFRTLAKTTREPAYRRARLCQFVSSNEDPFVSADAWDALIDLRAIPDGADVVIALDGSHSRDCTALVIGEIGTADRPSHFDTLALFTPRNGGSIDVLAVEDVIRQAAKRYRVRECVYDPFRWTRTGQVLAAEGVNMTEFPHSPSRLTKSTTELHTNITNGAITHTGDSDLRAHVLASTVVETDGGLRLGKQSRSRNAPRIDLAAALNMCASRCHWLSTHKTKRYRAIGV